MPGAFTTTCSAEHLPGYVKSADKLKALGIEKIAVITTNDRFVNEEWSNQQGLAKTKANDNMITILSDGDGDLVKNMGLAEDMGFGVGIRSKRFAMVVENGKVVDLFLDQGMEDCSATSAENVIKLLTPEVVAPEATEVDGKVIVGGVLVAVGALVLALLASQPSVDGAATTTPSRPRAAPQVRVEPPTKSSSSRQSESQFQLLNQYMSK